MGFGMLSTERKRRMTSEAMRSVGWEESDSTLVAATRNGQSQAFEFLVKRHETKTFSVAFGITRNREDAQDVVQQSFHKAFMHLDRFQGKSSFLTWLTRIVINEGLMCLRRNRARREVSLDDVESGSEDLFPPEIADRGENPGEIYEQLENERILCEAIKHLGAEFRTAVRLQLEERTARETAEILGLGIGTVKARMFRARQKLRVLLTRSQEFRRDPRRSKTRQRRESGLNSHPPAERATSQGSRAAGGKAKAAAAAGWSWRKGTRERTLQSTESRMLEVA
jgi:RNA polymerase sigma-70 factor, ECF subfamily